MALEDIKKVRLEKLEKIKAKGIDPYPAESHKTHYIDEAISDFENLEKNQTKITLAGRVMSLRGQGALIFSDIFDGTGKFQAFFKRDEMSEEVFDFWNEVIDVGDFVEVTGKVFITKRGEKTLKVDSWNILSKSLLPLPEKWQGLQDPEEKLRKRYLDILFDSELRALLEKKAKFWTATRDFLKSKGFLEVETPTLEITTGGAEARPFETHHNDY
ncbi:MAG: OB-fold nucleic acid binding domain-containing protein, partial [bacterium]